MEPSDDDQWEVAGAKKQAKNTKSRQAQKRNKILQREREEEQKKIEAERKAQKRIQEKQRVQEIRREIQETLNRGHEVVVKRIHAERQARIEFEKRKIPDVPLELWSTICSCLRTSRNNKALLNLSLVSTELRAIALISIPKLKLTSYTSIQISKKLWNLSKLTQTKFRFLYLDLLDCSKMTFEPFIDKLNFSSVEIFHVSKNGNLNSTVLQHFRNLRTLVLIECNSITYEDVSKFPVTLERLLISRCSQILFNVHSHLTPLHNLKLFSFTTKTAYFRSQFHGISKFPDHITNLELTNYRLVPEFWETLPKKVENIWFTPSELWGRSSYLDWNAVIGNKYPNLENIHIYFLSSELEESVLGDSVAQFKGGKNIVRDSGSFLVYSHLRNEKKNYWNGVSVLGGWD